MTTKEAKAIWADNRQDIPYSKLLQAYKKLHDLWTLEDCQYMCQMEIEMLSDYEDRGKRQVWARELIGIKKALIQQELAGSLTVNHIYNAPEKVDDEKPAE